jgi:hypothetical protein
MKLRTLQGWALLINAIIGLIDIATVLNGGNTPLFIVDELLALLFIFGLPAIGASQPQTGRLGQVGLWCLGIAAGIAFVVTLAFHVSTWQVSNLIPLSSALFFLVGSVAIGWLLIVGGILNLVNGLLPAGLIATLLGVIGVLAQTGAFAVYGWIIIRKSVQRKDVPRTSYFREGVEEL